MGPARGPMHLEGELMRLSAIATVVAAAGLLVSAGTAAAAPATDTTPPKLVADPYGRYRLGSQTTSDADFWFMDYYLKWKSSDPSGICQQTVTEQSYDTLGGPTDPVLGGETDTYIVANGATTYNYKSEFEDDMRVPARFVIRATDCAGNTAVSPIILTEFGVLEDGDPSITYTGSWRTVPAPPATSEGNTAHTTSQPGASFTMTGLQPGPLALVSTQRLNRGRVDVYVDGRFRATVDTGLAKQDRSVVWQIILKPGTTHTLEVVNQGTPGRARFDVDAVFTGHNGSRN